MRAASINRVGGPSEITCGELPDPVPGPRQALVRVRAAAINPIDTYVRAGTVPMPLEFPFVVGCDLAGDAGLGLESRAARAAGNLRRARRG
jgi:NADPH:quinone reductase